MKTTTLYNHFINEKTLTMQMIHDMNYLDINSFTWKFRDDVIIKLCYGGKKSLLYEITLKKISLTAMDRVIITDVLTKVFRGYVRLFSVSKLVNPFIKLITDNNINQTTKHNFEMIIFDIMSDVTINYSDIRHIRYYGSNIQLLKLVYGEHLNLHDKNMDVDINTCTVGNLDAQDINYKNILLEKTNNNVKLVENEIFLLENCSNINRFNMLCLQSDNMNLIKHAFNKIKSLNIYPNIITVKCLHSDYRKQDTLGHFLNNGFMPDFECIKLIVNNYWSNIPAHKTLILKNINFTMIEFNKIYSLMGPIAYAYKPDLSSDDFDYMFNKLIHKQYNPYDNSSESTLLGMLNRLQLPNPTKYIKLAIKHLPDSIVISLIDKGAILDKQCLILLCERSYISDELLNIFINHKLFIDKDCLKAYTNKFTLINTLNETAQMNYNNMILNLVGYGLIVDLECIDCMLKNKLFLSNLETYEIAYDDNLYNICNKNNFFPDEYMDRFAVTIGKYRILLRDMFNTERLETLEKYMKKYNLEIDNICLYNALHHNLSYIEIFNKYNYLPQLKDIISIKNSTQREQVYKTYYEKYDKKIIEEVIY